MGKKEKDRHNDQNGSTKPASPNSDLEPALICSHCHRKISYKGLAKGRCICGQDLGPASTPQYIKKRVSKAEIQDGKGPLAPSDPPEDSRKLSTPPTQVSKCLHALVGG
jgi:hypothetical protein